MKSALIALGFALMGASACHHSEDKAAAPGLPEYSQIELIAIDAVYEARPTRALVDKVETMAGSTEGQYVVNIEMTGAPTARKIYNVTINEDETGDLSLGSIETVQ